MEGMLDVGPNLIVLPRDLRDAFCLLQDVPILHMVEVMKVNRRGKRQRRILVITPTHLYSCADSGSIQRCVAVRSIAEVHTWSGQAPQVALRIPLEYDMLFHLGAAADVAALAAALQFAASTEAEGTEGVITIVEESQAINVTAYRLGRPGDCQWVMPSKLHWCIGSVGEVPPSKNPCDAIKPFFSANTRDISVFPANASMSSLSDAGAAAAPAARRWESALPMDCGPQDATHAMRGSSSDCSGDEETPSTSTATAAGGGAVGEGRENGVVVPKCSNDNRNGNIVGMPEMQACLQELTEALQRERWGRMEERENWSLLLAAERRNAYHLRQSIAELRDQVLALTSHNLILRAESLAREAG